MRQILRNLLAIVVALFAATALWIGYVTFRVLVPTNSEQPHTDAVVSLAPGQYRLPTALGIYRSGAADELLVSWFPEDFTADALKYPEARLIYEVCTGSAGVQALCFTPTPNTTLGEALAVRALAEDHGWRSVTVVTSSHHAFRAGFIFERCLPAETRVHVAAAPVQFTFDTWLYLVAYENAAFLKALVETAAEC